MAFELKACLYSCFFDVGSWFYQSLPIADGLAIAGDIEAHAGAGEVGIKILEHFLGIAALPFDNIKAAPRLKIGIGGGIWIARRWWVFLCPVGKDVWIDVTGRGLIAAFVGAATLDGPRAIGASE